MHRLFVVLLQFFTALTVCDSVEEVPKHNTGKHMEKKPTSQREAEFSFLTWHSSASLHGRPDVARAGTVGKRGENAFAGQLTHCGRVDVGETGVCPPADAGPCQAPFIEAR